MKTFFLSLLFISFIGTSFAQEVYRSSGKKGTAATAQKKKGFDTDRLVYGGSVGLAFGNGLFIRLQPKLGYAITKNFAAGVGLGYTRIVLKDRLEYYDPNINNYRYYDYKASVIAPSLWLYYVPFRFLFLQTEYEHNLASETRYRFNQFGNIETFKEKATIPVLNLGAGLRQPIAERASFNIGLFYNVLQNSGSIYNGIDIRTGIMIGI